MLYVKHLSGYLFTQTRSTNEHIEGDRAGLVSTAGVQVLTTGIVHTDLTGLIFPKTLIYAVKLIRIR